MKCKKTWLATTISNWFVKGTKKCGSINVSEKLATYSSPRLTLTLTSHLGKNVGLGEG